jgi:hypothetical protein
MAGLLAFFCGLSPASAGELASDVEERRPACFGAREPMVLINHRPYIKVTINGASRLFLLDFGSTVTSVDLDRLKIPAEGNVVPQGYSAGVTIRAFGTPTLILAANRDLGFHSVEDPLYGILGTNVLSSSVYTLDYEEGWVYKSGAYGFCSDALSTKGRYQHPSLPFPMVLPKKVNVPMVDISIGGVRAMALLDTGFGTNDAEGVVETYSVFYDALQKAEQIMITPAELARMSTCREGAVELVSVHYPNPGVGVQWGAIAADGMISTLPIRVHLRSPEFEVMQCGAISLWAFPAAVVSASLIEERGLVVFDPFSARVWVKRKASE